MVDALPSGCHVSNDASGPNSGVAGCGPVRPRDADRAAGFVLDEVACASVSPGSRARGIIPQE
jgi:hypothetical protein